MKKIKTLFTGGCLIAVIVVTGIAVYRFTTIMANNVPYEYPANKYGAFLAIQHAIYVNDFETAAQFAKNLSDKDIPLVHNAAMLSEFLNGTLPETAAMLKEETGLAAQMIYAAHLVQKNDWAAIYSNYKSNESTLITPLRIWSAVATGKSSDALKFIDSLKTNDSWKAFIRGQIYAETNKIDDAAKQFAKVSVDFMNVNDYMYIMAFYNHNNMVDAANMLRIEFTSRPGGMYMLDIDISPKWSDYSGYNNALAFSLIQNVSHTQIMMYSDLSMILLRFAQIIQQSEENNAINYYMGLFFFNNGGNYEKHMELIEKNSPFYPFAMMKISEKTDKMDKLESLVKSNPLFVPAAVKLIAKHVQQGHKKTALKIVDRALKNKNLTEQGRAFFLKNRAQIYMTFGDLKRAQSDIHEAASVLTMDVGILAIQSKIWSKQKRELETAYEYAIALIKRNPTDIEYWDVLGLAVWAKEGPTAALEVIDRVGQVSESCSVLFEHLGDLHTELGNKKLAKDAYLRAIKLSEDGLTVVPHLEKKLRDLK